MFREYPDDDKPSIKKNLNKIFITKTSIVEDNKYDWLNIFECCVRETQLLVLPF